MPPSWLWTRVITIVATTFGVQKKRVLMASSPIFDLEVCDLPFWPVLLLINFTVFTQVSIQILWTPNENSICGVCQEICPSRVFVPPCSFWSKSRDDDRSSRHRVPYVQSCTCRVER